MYRKEVMNTMTKFKVGNRYRVKDTQITVVSRSRCFIDLSDGTTTLRFEIKHEPKITERGSVTKKSEYVTFGYNGGPVRLSA